MYDHYVGLCVQLKEGMKKHRIATICRRRLGHDPDSADLTVLSYLLCNVNPKQHARDNNAIEDRKFPMQTASKYFSIVTEQLSW